MIIGVGVDLCYVERLRRSITRFGDKWVKEIFTLSEQEQYTSYIDSVVWLTQAFCLKEACAKALGTGMASEVWWLNIEVLLAEKVKLRLSGGARQKLIALTPENCRAKLAISSTGNHLVGYACVVATAVPLVGGGVRKG